jgi:hypothetical protein
VQCRLSKLNLLLVYMGPSLQKLQEQLGGSGAGAGLAGAGGAGGAGGNSRVPGALQPRQRLVSGRETGKAGQRGGGEGEEEEAEAARWRERVCECES